MKFWTRRPSTVDRPVRSGSLRRRVIVGVLALLLAVLLTLGAVVNLVLGDRLRSDLRQRLTDRAQLASVLAAQTLAPQQLTDRLTGQGITAAYLANGQVIVGRDQGPPPGSQNPSGRPFSPGGPGRDAASSTVSVRITQSGEQLIAEVTATPGRLRLTANLADIDHTLSTLHRIELLAGAATLVVTGLMLAGLIGIAMSPLNRMTRLARRITDGARGGRLRPTRPNTDLGRTATAFDDMLDALELAESQAQRAEERMRTFLADASHDLRTPIAGIVTTAERLLRDGGSRADREHRLVLLIREAQRAGRLVEDLLLMARLDSGEATAAVRTEPVSMTAVVRSALDRAAPAPGTTPVNADLSAGPFTVLGDRDALDRILGNLLDNAQVAAGSAGGVTVQIQARPGWVTVRIEDPGPGVPAAEAERIFGRFVRLDPSRGGQPGTGLGLPIARALARAQGGDLVCRPVPVGGCFVLTLPSLPAGIGPAPIPRPTAAAPGLASV